MILRKILHIVGIFIGTLIVVSVVCYLFFPTFIETKLGTVVQFAQNSQVGKDFLSLPLVQKATNPTAALTIDGVILLTNNERAKENLPALTENSKLDSSAAIKLKDMFDRQYFEHISPDNHGPGYLADQAGYAYIVIGENLALGNFKDNAALVAAWMASPGHRANIMNKSFANIGVAVGEGMYKGKKTWLAVQEFGAPTSVCPEISASLKAQIDKDKVDADVQSQKLDTLKQELAGMPHDSEADRAAYNAKVDEYNKLVGAYGTLSTQLKSEVDTYNREVRAFNTCLNSTTASEVHAE